MGVWMSIPLEASSLTKGVFWRSVILAVGEIDLGKSAPRRFDSLIFFGVCTVCFEVYGPSALFEPSFCRPSPPVVYGHPLTLYGLAVTAQRFGSK